MQRVARSIDGGRRTAAEKWILVANAAHAALFAGRGRSLRQLEEFGHPQSRKKVLDLVTDRNGRYEATGNKHGAFAPTVEPKRVERARFARELADVLERGRMANRYQRLVLVAAPHFLGMLLGSLTPAVRARLSDTVKKDFTGVDAERLCARLARFIVI